ncbi:MAG: hypothetical protein NTX45_06565 [Proteobacteria bacterium]|nr:hypothetical protein [Pseudomonadota bacterium]
MSIFTRPAITSTPFISMRRVISMQAYTVLLALLSLVSYDAQACDAPLASFCVDYFNSRDMSGPVIFSASETGIDHTWGNASPIATVPIETEHSF